MKRILLFSMLAMTLTACQQHLHDASYYMDYANRFAVSQMTHDPQLWMSDGMKKPKWDYTQALVGKAMLQTYQATADSDYLKYAMDFADYFIHEDGSIETYKKSVYNIDRVNGGSFLFVLNDICPEPRFAAAMDTLYSQLETHPRTSEGGFWHKQIYPHQMWLDGIYMAEPFYCRYAAEHHNEAGLDDVTKQFVLIDSHTYDSVSGLNYHGWDESREQAWSDSITGCSPHFWGRAMGWYLMAMVDVLDYMPESHPGYARILSMLQRSAENLLRYQDPETHLWYQVLDMGTEEGNYQEATCSSIFCYVFAKGANRGYLPKQFRHEAELVFDGIVNNLVLPNPDGTISLTQCCAVAGLGGNPYRSGTYDYYINERINSDDPKGIGPIIFAALELAK